MKKTHGINYGGNKIKFAGTKSPKELAELIAKRDAPPELSDTAKAFVRKTGYRYKRSVHRYKIKIPR
jgi:hypothetical protein